MGSWGFQFNAGGTFNICNSGDPGCEYGSMVTGPATPPLGIGSANLGTTLGNGDGAASIGTSSLNGVSLDDLTSLSYSTYDTQNNGSQFPVLRINISYTGTTTCPTCAGTDSLFFEPPYQTPSSGSPSLPNQGQEQMNTWQTWNALEGGWWDNNGFANPGTGVQSLATLEGDFIDPVITPLSPYHPNYGLTLFVGDASPTDLYNGYVDNVTIGVSGANNTYDFEPNSVATPEPSAIMILATMLFAVGLVLRKRIARG